MSTLQDKGIPMPVEHTLVAPPECRMGAITDAERMQVRAGSPVGMKYDEAIDRAMRERGCEGLPKPKGVSRDPAQAVLDVLAERRRQIEAEGWTPEHDDEHSVGELAKAAACYVLVSAGFNPDATINVWPWHRLWWKPSDKRRNLVKAGALILAEIERLDRMAERQEGA